MKFWEIEKGLKLCSVGAKEKLTRCSKCPYVEEGCLSALFRDASRYIDYLKSPRHIYNERKKAESATPPQKAKPTPPPKRGKPVSEWLEEERKERERKGEKDCGDIPW